MFGLRPGEGGLIPTPWPWPMQVFVSRLDPRTSTDLSTDPFRGAWRDAPRHPRFPARYRGPADNPIAYQERTIEGWGLPNG